MAQQTSEPEAPDQGLRAVPDERTDASGPPRSATPPERVPLDRLLTVVVLSPAQAVLVAARVLAAVRTVEEDDGTPADDGGRWSVALTPSGEVEVTRAAEDEGARVHELLAQLTDNARRLPTHPAPAQVALLRALEEVTAGRPRDAGSQACELERVSREHLGRASHERLTTDLAALVGAFSHVAPSLTAPPGVRTSSRSVRDQAHRAAPARPVVPRSRPVRLRRRRGLPRRGGRSRRLVPAVVLLVAAVVGSGYVVLRDPGAAEPGGSAQDTATAPPSKAETTKAPRSTPATRHRAATLAPRQSDAITGVSVQRAGACAPGAPCPVTTTVRLRPASTTRSVVWRVGTAQWCGRAITWSAPLTVTAQPGWTRVYASSTVSVPPGRALALVSLTTAPGRVQSAPVPATGSSLRC